MIEVRLNGVSVLFGARAVIDNFDLKIEGGDFACLLGPSGSGKSTLLRVIAGLLEPTRGSVGRTEGPLGFVFQEPRLLPWRTVRENLLLPAQIAGRSGVDVERPLRDVGLWEERETFPHQLSGGMRQRVAIARALIGEPRLLLLDEPFSALDEITRFGLEDLLRGLWERLGLTTIFVTHSMHEAAYLGERVLVLDRGGGLRRDERFRFARRDDELRFSPEFNARVGELSRAIREGRPA